jgi:hypothetical protein
VPPTRNGVYPAGTVYSGKDPAVRSDGKLTWIVTVVQTKVRISGMRRFVRILLIAVPVGVLLFAMAGMVFGVVIVLEAVDTERLAEKNAAGFIAVIGYLPSNFTA